MSQVICVGLHVFRCKRSAGLDPRLRPQEGLHTRGPRGKGGAGRAVRGERGHLPTAGDTGAPGGAGKEGFRKLASCRIGFMKIHGAN